MAQIFNGLMVTTYNIKIMQVTLLLYMIWTIKTTYQNKD